MTRQFKPNETVDFAVVGSGAAGGVMADIVKLNYYLVAEVDQAIVPKLRPIRDRYINVEKPPASTFVVVSRLMRPGWLIEIEAIAAIDE